jgi:hypothetical protein
MIKLDASVSEETLKQISGELISEELLWHDIQRAKGTDVLVGIPEENTLRKDSDEMNNATLLYIHTKGSPAKNLPARPLIEPALTADDNAEKIADLIGQMADQELAGEVLGANKKANRLGITAVNIIKRWFVDPRNGWPPNAPSTVRAKLKKIRSKKKRENLLERYLQGDASVDTPLIDTAQMRGSITYVVRRKGRVIKND